MRKKSSIIDGFQYDFVDKLFLDHPLDPDCWITNFLTGLFRRLFIMQSCRILTQQWRNMWSGHLNIFPIMNRLRHAKF